VLFAAALPLSWECAGTGAPALASTSASSWQDYHRRQMRSASRSRRSTRATHGQGAKRAPTCPRSSSKAGQLQPAGMAGANMPLALPPTSASWGIGKHPEVLNKQARLSRFHRKPPFLPTGRGGGWGPKAGKTRLQYPGVASSRWASCFGVILGPVRTHILGPVRTHTLRNAAGRFHEFKFRSVATENKSV
jgi:hypothetical protein